MKFYFLLSLLIIGLAQEELSEEEAIAILKDLKNATTMRLELIDKQWKKYSDKKNDQICVFTEMMQEQTNQCSSRNTENVLIQESLNQSTESIESFTQRIANNQKRQNNLEGLKCKQNINNIKLLKDQKDISALSISLQKSFAESRDVGLIEMIEQNQLYEHTELIITEEENTLIQSILQSDQIVNGEATTQIQIATAESKDQTQSFPYSSQKQMDKNKRLILGVSQEISQTVSKDQEKMTNNQVASTYRVDNFSKQLVVENQILQKQIGLEQERKIDLQDQLTILEGQNSECGSSQKKMEMIALLLEQDLDREQILYRSQKESILKELDMYTDLLRYYLRQIYKK